MADITKVENIKIAQWQLPDSGVPKLAQSCSAADTTLVFTAPIKDASGTIITGGIRIGIQRKTDGYVESVWIPEGELSADGLTATNVERGVALEGLGLTTANADLAVAHDEGDVCWVAADAILWQMGLSFILGNIASGGNSIVIGDETDTTITLQHKDATGLAPFLRRNIASGEVEFSDDRGGSWTAINDVTASNLLDVSAADTTPGYLDSKVAVDGILTKQILNPGANEQLELSTPAGVTTSAGAGDSGKVPLLNVNGKLHNSFNDYGDVITAKGDLLVGGAAGVADTLPVGTDGKALMADSSEASGLRWGNVSTGAYDAHNSSDFTGGSTSFVKVPTSEILNVNAPTAALITFSLGNVGIFTGGGASSAGSIRLYDVTNGTTVVEFLNPNATAPEGNIIYVPASTPFNLEWQLRNSSGSNNESTSGKTLVQTV